MKCSFAALVVSLLLLHSYRVYSEHAEVDIYHKWPRGFYGELSFELEEDVEDGWQVTVTFSKPVKRLYVWNAKLDSVSDDKKVYVLKNKFWNGKLEAGGPLRFRFLGRKAKFGESAPTMSAELARLGEGSGF